MKGKIWGILRRLVPFVLIAVVAVLFFCMPKGEEGKASERSVVEIWNIETFEGGKGSRTAFLNRVGRKIGTDGVYFYVLNYTPEGAEEAFSRGKYPDVLSFGIGFGGLPERSLPLPYTSSGGELGGKCLAVPWCAGGYALYSLEDDFSAEGSVAVSKGGSNLVSLAARLAGISGEELPSEEAYVDFLNGKYRYLLGTQRDACRFRARNVGVYSQKLTQFNDIIQYVSILSRENWENCLLFLDALRSEETQASLSEIGMEPPDSAEGMPTLSVFSSRQVLLELDGLAHGGGDLKILEKYLKSR